MENRQVTIHTGAIEQQANSLEQEASRLEAAANAKRAEASMLRKLLENWVRHSEQPRVGRPRSNPLYSVLVTLVRGYNDNMLTSNELRKAVQDSGIMDRYGDKLNSAIKMLINDGILAMTEQPVGRKPGIYKILRKEGSSC